MKCHLQFLALKLLFSKWRAFNPVIFEEKGYTEFWESIARNSKSGKIRWIHFVKMSHSPSQKYRLKRWIPDYKCRE
jgi:hypothetical protein